MPINRRTQHGWEIAGILEIATHDLDFIPVKAIFQKAQTKIKAINRKMACGLIATFSVVVFGFILLSPFWFWTCLEIISGLLVAVGCWGEWYLFKNPADEGNERAKLLHHRREVLCIIMVAVGVTLEFAALTHSIPEAIRLEKDVAEIGTTNAQLVASNLVNLAAIEMVRSNNNVLAERLDDSIKARLEIETALLPRKLKNKDEAIEKLRTYAGTKFMVFCPPDADGEMSDFAINISMVLSDAGWIYVPKDLPMASSGIKSAFILNPSPQNHADVNLSAFTPNDPILKQFFNSNFLTYVIFRQQVISLRAGVSIDFRFEPPKEPLTQFGSIQSAGDVLTQVLDKSKIKSDIHLLPDLGEPKDVVFVLIGKKPDLIQIQREQFDLMQFWRDFYATNQMLRTTNKELYLKLMQKQQQRLMGE